MRNFVSGLLCVALGVFSGFVVENSVVAAVWFAAGMIIFSRELRK